MIVVRFRSNDEHEDLLKKIKKMRKFTEELEDMLEECYDEEEESNSRSSKMYRKNYDDEDMRMENHPSYRYNFRRGMRG